MSHYTAYIAAACLSLTITATPALAGDAPKKELTVYTYDSFVSDWGMGPLIKPTFEEQCGCTLNLVGMSDAVAMLQRLKLEGASTKADLLLGLDLNLVDDAKKSGLFANHSVDTNGLEMPIDWQDDTFVPFDYGYFAFVYNTKLMPNPPKSLDELVNAGPELKIIIQDPRSSTPGLGLLLWMKSVYGNESDAAWAKLSDNILTTTKGWSEAYFSLFMAGEAPMVLSYSTSPAYHMAVEGTDQYQAAEFEEGHYLQVEVAAKLKSSQNSALADDFLNFMVSEGFQKHLPLSNVMYPVNTPADMPEAYGKLIKPTQVLQLDTAEINQNRKQWVNDWLNVMTQ
ncbi:thiamine ABC transporter substrate binding subunit [Candidatus Njordibacter sp. Uisw_056]|jgi:thiamine transport system substrate-binding protein|uniref:thiamine ABC transporter substrate binding subunit n=1 Tax=Candidatus Njordibacter sp. Uisw_056 TaxID=3230973 RepID=UPI003D57EC0D|tara:strand:+ start:3060 stop:4079 length:1020 start_codon:yes stop_codon:yes gene_type:complete